MVEVSDLENQLETTKQKCHELELMLCEQKKNMKDEVELACKRLSESQARCVELEALYHLRNIKKMNWLIILKLLLPRL